MIKQWEEKVIALIDENEILHLLQDLIEARSDYPPGDTRQVCDVCMKKFLSEEIDCKLVVPENYVTNPKDHFPSSNYPSVIAQLSGSCSNGPVLLFNAHVDTVSAGELNAWKTAPYQAIFQNGNVYGRGAGDDKGSVCAQIMAAILLKRAGVPLRGTLQVNPVSDEEANSCRGAKWLRDSHQLHPDMVIVGEQTNNQIAVAERAVVFVRIVIHGKACHGAMPWSGSNATMHMAHFIEHVEKEMIPAVEAVGHPYLPLTTISPTHIQGGFQVNIIPETCMLELDCRLTPGVSEEWLLQEFDRILKCLSEETDSFEYEIEVTNSEKGVITDTDPSEPLVQAMRTAYKKTYAVEPEYTGYMQASDGRIFSKLKVPVVIFGPGDPALGHAPNEFVPLAQVVEATKILALTAIQLLC